VKFARAAVVLALSLNGYSGWVPKNWDVAHPPDGVYLERVDDSICRKHLTNVCALDIDLRTMGPYSPQE
jgi:hypothetical protein